MSWFTVGLCWYVGLIVMETTNVWYLRRRRDAPVATDGPVVSIVVPARNEAHNLQRLIPTLLEQHYRRFELIIYDDGSEDGTADVAAGFGDSRIRILRGHGPPPGWIGKVHALFSATRRVEGDVLLFLDADAQLLGPHALGRLVGRFLHLADPRVLSGLPRLRGGRWSMLLISMIPFSMLGLFPVPLAPIGRAPILGALNGQCWMIDRDAYYAHEPHRAHPCDVLEDIRIGRYLKGHGAPPHLFDLQQDVDVRMYGSFAEAWRGFRKNTYLAAGGRPAIVLPLAVAYLVLFVVLPATSVVALTGLYVAKAIADRHSGFPIWVTLLTPVSIALAFVLLLDSARAHLTGRVEWKGRRVSP